MASLDRILRSFAPAYSASRAQTLQSRQVEQARTDRLKAGELAQANLLEQRRIQADAIKKAREQAIADRIERNKRENLQAEVRRKQELDDAWRRIEIARQDKQDALTRGDDVEARKAQAVIDSLDPESRSQVQPKAPRLLGGPAMEVPGALPMPMEGGYPLYEGSPEIMEDIRKSLSEEKGEIPIGSRLAAAAKGERLQKARDAVLAQKAEYETKRGFEAGENRKLIKSVKRGNSPYRDLIRAMKTGETILGGIDDTDLETATDERIAFLANQIKPVTSSWKEDQKPIPVGTPHDLWLESLMKAVLKDPTSEEGKLAQAQLDHLKGQLQLPVWKQKYEEWKSLIEQKEKEPDEAKKVKIQAKIDYLNRPGTDWMEALGIAFGGGGSGSGVSGRLRETDKHHQPDTAPAPVKPNPALEPEVPPLPTGEETGPKPPSMLPKDPTELLKEMEKKTPLELDIKDYPEAKQKEVMAIPEGQSFEAGGRTWVRRGSKLMEVKKEE